MRMRQKRKKPRPQTGKKPKRTRWKRKLLAQLDLPEETVEAVPKLTMLGRSDLLVENHKGVLQYGECTVRLFTEEGILCIAGEGLSLMELGASRAYVKGTLCGVAYEK